MKKGIFLLTALCFFACNNNVLFKADKEITNTWHTDSLLIFQFRTNDTNITFYSEINIRHTIEYSYKNLFVFVRQTNPEGQTVVDTVECVLADKTGKWKGRGVGDILDFTKRYNDSILFETSGEYKIEIEQAMRYGELPKIERLKGIVSIGVSIRRRGE